MKQKLRVGILGAGRIAAGFDSPGADRVLTLAHAVQKSGRFQLGGFFDTQPGRAAAAERKWHCPASPRKRAAWLAVGWDVICIATPDAAHPMDLQKVLQLKPKAVLVEKPLALDGRAAVRLLLAARQARVPLLVDFPRREHPAVQQVTELLHSGKLGKVRRVEGVFSGGLRHNGVHLLDLVAAWLPPVRAVRKLGSAGNVTLLELSTTEGRLPLSMVEAAQPDCYVWELRVETERGRIELSGAPEQLRLLRLGQHPNYPRFTTLVDERTWPMEEEPLLLHVMARLARLVDSSAAAQEQWKLELERQRFSNKVFAHFRH